MGSLPNILIVDDNWENIFLLETILQKVEVNLIKAFSGFEALEKTRGIELAVSILDVQMPEMNGFELAIKINKERTFNKVPIIFLTANNYDGVMEGYDSGGVDYIYKPVNPRILISKIKVFLDLYSQKQEIINNAILLKNSADALAEFDVALINSEEKYKTYINNAPDGIFVTDRSGKYLEVNSAATNITGYSQDEFLKMYVSDILIIDSIDQGKNLFESRFETGRFEGDFLFKHKNGTNRWCAVQFVNLDETRLLGFMKDITSRKKTDDELKNSLEQLQQLSQYTERARESERKAISRELHDELGQALTAIKIDLRVIRQKIFDNDVILKIDKTSTLVGDTIKRVQRLTSQLRPEIIDDLGLDAAIRWYTKEFAERTGIEVTLDLNLDISISPDDSLSLFRIMQESLTNIARHSGASDVEIKLTNNSNCINFVIQDNGIGITNEELNSKKSFGLLGLKERALSLAGTCDIVSKKNEGTVISLIFPLLKKLEHENIDLR